eukprot:4130542-Pleurochrysis_carterae.AAC.1
MVVPWTCGAGPSVLPTTPPSRPPSVHRLVSEPASAWSLRGRAERCYRQHLRRGPSLPARSHSEL